MSSIRGWSPTRHLRHLPETMRWRFSRRLHIHSSARHGVALVRQRQWGKLRLIVVLKWRLLNPSSLFRKVSAHEFERGGLLKPIVNTIDGTLTFLSITSQNESGAGSAQNQNGNAGNVSRTHRLSRNELKHLDEKEMIFELVSLIKWFSTQLIYHFSSL